MGHQPVNAKRQKSILYHDKRPVLPGKDSGKKIQIIKSSLQRFPLWSYSVGHRIWLGCTKYLFCWLIYETVLNLSIHVIDY